MFRPPEGPGIRLDTGVREGDDVTPNYDPMLAKLIVWAPSRPEALEKMRRALDEFVVLGTTTNIEFLRDLCDAEPVVSGTTTTTTIDDLWPNGWNPPASLLEDAALLVAAGAETLGLHPNTLLQSRRTAKPAITRSAPSNGGFLDATHLCFKRWARRSDPRAKRRRRSRLNSNHVQHNRGRLQVHPVGDEDGRAWSGSRRQSG